MACALEPGWELLTHNWEQVSTSGCVRATALDALCHGFAPFVVREACGDRDERPHEQNLFDMAAKMAEVVSESEAIGLMQKGNALG